MHALTFRSIENIGNFVVGGSIEVHLPSSSCQLSHSRISILSEKNFRLLRRAERRRPGLSSKTSQRTENTRKKKELKFLNCWEQQIIKQKNNIEVIRRTVENGARTTRATTTALFSYSFFSVFHIFRMEKLPQSI